MDDPTAMWRDAELCYRVAMSRDQRFDGWFVMAVRTTGIYCRPSCPAITPRRRNVEFHASAAAAQRRGFRACKRCRPDASPGSPDWDLRGDLVGRAVRLIGDGVVDREGVAGLAARLGYSSRHLTRLLTDELGAGPLALAREQRSRTARILIETTTMPMSEVAFAAGFSSLRQFNETVRAVYATSPTELRQLRAATRNGDGRAGGGGGGGIVVRLAVRQPFAGDRLLAFLAARAVRGVEHAADATVRRSLRLPHGHGIVEVAPGEDSVTARFRLEHWQDLAPAVRRTRRWLDLDADPVAVDQVLGSHRMLAPSVRRIPGLRVPGSVDPVETAFRAVVGQQVSVAGARTVLGRLVEDAGEPVALPDPHVRWLFPSPEALLGLDEAAFAMPGSRRRTIRALAAACLDGTVELHDGVDRTAAAVALQRVPGIGPWTAGYVRMRGLGDPDVFLGTDLGVVRALGRGAEIDDAVWRPWRSYALHHLWELEQWELEQCELEQERR